MNGKSKPKASNAFACLLCILPLAAQAQAQEPIGRVVMTKGQVSVRTPDGTMRSIARGTRLFEGDTLLTDAEGLAQVRLVDDATLSLGRNTHFVFNAYAFDGDATTPDLALMTLEAGCFRAVSGQVGSALHDERQFDTPVASISVREATHEAVYDGEFLYTGTRSGVTTVSNAAGSLDLGLGSAYDFSHTAAGSAPAGVAAAHAALSGCAR